MFCRRGAETDGRLTVERGALDRVPIDLAGGRLTILLRPVLGAETVGRELRGPVVEGRETVERGAVAEGREIVGRGATG